MFTQAMHPKNESRMFCVSSQKMRSRDGSAQLEKSQATKSLKSGSTSYLHLCVVVVTEPANARSANATAVCVRCDLAKDRNFDVTSALPCSTDSFAAIALHTDSTAESVWSCITVSRHSGSSGGQEDHAHHCENVGKSRG